MAMEMGTPRFSSAFLGQTLQNRLSIPSKNVSHFRSLSPRVVSSDGQAKRTVLVAEELGKGGLELLRSEDNMDCSYNLSQEELCTKISLCDAFIVRSGTKVTHEVFESSCGRLKVVGRAGVGIDNVDLQAATEFGCLVVNAPTANTVVVAEHGIALIASTARNVPQADASMKAEEGRMVVVAENPISLTKIPEDAQAQPPLSNADSVPVKAVKAAIWKQVLNKTEEAGAKSGADSEAGTGESP